MIARRTLAVALGSAAFVVPLSGASGQIVTIPSISATVGGAYSTNPFLTAAGEDSASVQFDVRPQLQVIDGTNEAVVSVNYNRADYLKRYGSNDGYGAAVSGTTRPNARTTLGFTAAYDSQILGAQNGFITPANPIITNPVLPTTSLPTTGTGPVTGGVTQPLPVVPVLTPDLSGVNGDIGLIGLRQRRNTLSAGLSGSYAPDVRSTWNAGVNVVRSSYPDQRSGPIVASSFRTYSANMGYNRSLSELSSVGFQISASHVESEGGFDSDIYNPRLTYSRSLSERVSMNASVGAGITDDAFGTNVSVSVDGSLCRTGERLQGCLNASRQPTVSGFGGVRVQTNVGGSLNYQVNQFTFAGLSANYSHIGSARNASSPLLNIDDQNFFVANASLQRQLGRIFSVVASVSYRSAGINGIGGVNGINGINGDIPGDVTGRLGISAFWSPRR